MNKFIQLNVMDGRRGIEIDHVATLLVDPKEIVFYTNLSCVSDDDSDNVFNQFEGSGMYFVVGLSKNVCLYKMPYIEIEGYDCKMLVVDGWEFLQSMHPNNSGSGLEMDGRINEGCIYRKEEK